MKNAFNGISREALLATVFAKNPLIYNYTEAANAKPSFLFHRDKIILSEEGGQQSDPEGRPLFSDTINDTIRSLCSKLNLWYVDDGNLAGTFEDVLNDYTTLRSAFLAMGLEVNPQKCELVFLGCTSNEQKQSILSKFSEVCPGVQVTELEDLVVLGAPIGSAALESTVEEKTQVLQAFYQKLQRIDADYALFLIKNSLHMPRLLYVLRTSPCFKLCEKLQRIDNYLRASLESICNVSLSESRDKQVFLPVKLGGMGIPSAVLTTFSAILASAVGCEPFSQNLNLNLGSDRDVESALTAWYELSGVNAMPVAKREAQKTWSTPVLDKLQIDIEQSLDQTQSKRFSLTQGRYAGAWLNAIPMSPLGLKLTDGQLRCAVALRLGAKICAAHTCCSGQNVDEYGTHGLAGKRSAGRFARHAFFNDFIRRFLASVVVPSVLEPAGFSRADGKRPDGVTAIPWQRGKPLVWDVTFVDSIAPSRTQQQGSFSPEAETRKTLKYANIEERGYIFQPIAIDVQGNYGTQIETFNCLTKKIIDNTREPRSKSFFFINACQWPCNSLSCVTGALRDDAQESGRSVLYVLKLLREGISGIAH